MTKTKKTKNFKMSNAKKASAKKAPVKVMHKAVAKAKKIAIKKVVKSKPSVQKKAIIPATKPASPKNTLYQNEQKIKMLDSAKLKEKEANLRKKTNISIPQPEEAKVAITSLLSNERAVEYLKKNVSKLAVDVVDMLSTPKTDEYLAEQLGMKINAIRRILNIMQGYGITNYYISKNTKGWLSFAWYINTSKLTPFLEYVDGMEREKSIINEKCDDYFLCDACYKTDKFLFTFDSAFENSFKCNNCGKGLNRMNREEVEVLINKKVATPEGTSQ
ncbi:MAG: hypothetical protein ABR981_00345 [Candidatus Micrarchaeaceae archaeon]|jgi:transcription initiation factor IIE alpha subunit